jgi:hypothetical protein
MKLSKEDIDQFATEEEKEFLKEYGERSLQKYFKDVERHKKYLDRIEKEKEEKEKNKKKKDKSSQLTEAKNTKGKTRKVDDPYEIYDGSGPLSGWQWRVLKHYQSPENEKKNPYARVFCAVKSPLTYGEWEMGDVYCRNIPNYRYEDGDEPDFSKTVDKQRIKNLSDQEVDMIADMFK